MNDGATVIEVSHAVPPIYKALRARFGVDWDGGLIIAYGGRIHCKRDPDPQKIVHEAVHLAEQSRVGNDAWWSAYLDSADFRIAEEVKAYRAEADFLRRHIRNREHLFHYMRDIVDSLSGPTYGNACTREYAYAAIIK